MIGSSRSRVARAGGTPHITLPGYATLVPLLVSTRPEQWSKNLFVFAALLFGNRLLQPDAVVMAFATFAIFCGLSAAVYLLNDIADRDVDRQHPLKRTRPIASGAVPVLDLITHRLPLERLLDAIDIVARGDAIKVTIEP